MHPARNAAATCCHTTSRGYRVHHQPGNQARAHAHTKKNPPRHAENSDVSLPLTYALLTASGRSAPAALAFALPLPFCHAVYQDRLRKDVKKMIAVATVPFLSLISFQRCLFPRLGVAGAPGAAVTSLARCLHGAAAPAGAGVGVYIRGRQRDVE